MAYKMKGFSGFKAAPTKFRLDSKKPFSKGLDMTLNENLNKAVRGKGPGSPKTLSAKEFLRKNTVKPKPQKPLSRPYGKYSISHQCSSCLSIGMLSLDTKIRGWSARYWRITR